MVNGPIVADAIKDPNNRLNKFVLSEKDDGKAADEIYLAVLNRLPTATERTAAIAAIRAAAADHAAMIAEYKPKADAFDAYKKTLDVKQQAWEDGLKGQKPTVWLPVDVRRADPKTPDTVLKLNRDGSVLATGKAPETELYTIYGLTETDRPITAIRLEALADSSLPVKGPGRADNGNFVLNEFRLTYKALDKPDATPAAIKLTSLGQIFAQDTFPAANAVDGNPATGWATAPRFGQDNAALFKFDKPVSGPAGVFFTAVLDHRFGTKHIIGKFRLSVTTDPNPKLQSLLTAEQVALLDTPADKRTQAQKDALRQMYLAQDKEYARLAADAANVPPADARVLGRRTWCGRSSTTRRSCLIDSRSRLVASRRRVRVALASGSRLTLGTQARTHSFLCSPKSSACGSNGRCRSARPTSTSSPDIRPSCAFTAISPHCRKNRCAPMRSNRSCSPRARTRHSDDSRRTRTRTSRSSARSRASRRGSARRCSSRAATPAAASASSPTRSPTSRGPGSLRISRRRWSHCATGW